MLYTAPGQTTTALSVSCFSSRIELALFGTMIVAYAGAGGSQPEPMMSASDRNLVDYGLMLGRKSSPWCGNRVTANAHWNGYGCWCGRGNKADTAVDEFDAACKAHDLCYEAEVCKRAPAGILLDYPWRGKLWGEVSKKPNGG